jgi:hypothetical protein
VGGPIAADGKLLVLTISSSHHIRFQAIAPATGAVKWTVPYSASYITEGVAVTPIEIGGVALSLTPISTPTSPLVKIDGISVSTGKTIWSDPSVVVTDVPTVCGNGKDFCVDESPTPGSQGLEVLNPTTGKRLSFISGLERALMSGLYQTNSVSPVLRGLGSSGKVAWTKSVASLFGGPKYDPSGGWDFLQEGSFDVGSVNDVGTPTSPPPTIPLSALKTIAIDPASGTVKWHDAGEFDCMGTVALSVPVLCRYTGTAHYHGGKYSLAGVGLTLQGFNVESGAVTWSRQVTDVSQLTLGSSLRVTDGHDLYVSIAHGRKGVLDLSNGTFHGVAASQVFWCQFQNLYTAIAVAGDRAHGKKVGTFRYAGCTLTSSTNAVPRVGAKALGVEIDSRFVWPSPTGLKAARIPAN